MGFSLFGKTPFDPQHREISFFRIPAPLDPRQNGPRQPPERPYLGPQGHIGPQTGFTAPAVSVRSNLVGRRFTQNGPQDWENPLLWRLRPVSGPAQPQNFYKFPRPPKISKSRIAAVGGRTIKSAKGAKVAKVAQHERGSAEPKIGWKLPGGAELRLQRL